MNIPTIDERLMRRVKKALALSVNNSNSEESQTAMLKAQEMLAKHNLTLDDVELEDSEKQDKEVNEGDATDYTKLQWWMKHLGSIIADNFRCYSFIRTYGGKTKLVFLGVDEDVQIAKEVYNFAIESIKHSSKQYLKENNISGNRSVTIAVKNDYISGYLQGLQDKFKEQVEKNNWGLILVKDDAVIERYEGMKMGRGRPTSRSTNGDAEAKARGYRDGKSFNNSRKGIEG